MARVLSARGRRSSGTDITIVGGASHLGQRPSNDQGTEGTLFSQSFQSALYSIPDHEKEGSRSNTPEPPHPAAALDNEKDIDHDEMDSHETENAKATKATSLRRQHLMMMMMPLVQEM